MEKFEPENKVRKVVGECADCDICRFLEDLLKLLPAVHLKPVDGSLHCCGMGGIMGFKREFHDTSIHLGN